VYSILLERSAEKDLGRLAHYLHDHIITAIQKLAHNPRPSGGRKLTGTENDWRIRVGDFA
jgi:mRNA interferase RelE/StbE